MPCEKCSWFKIVIMIFWKGWRSPTPLKPKIHCFLVGGIGRYSLYFLLNLQLMWNALKLMSMWKSQVLMAWALLTEAVLIDKLKNVVFVKTLRNLKDEYSTSFFKTFKSHYYQKAGWLSRFLYILVSLSIVLVNLGHFKVLKRPKPSFLN
jgi:hypothetical protein